MGKTLYIECFSGISGDMMVATLLDLGANPQRLKSELNTLPIKGFDTEIKRVKKAGLDCCDFSVKLERKWENHDHDNSYLYGHREGGPVETGCCHEHSHEHSCDHSHERSCEHGHEHNHEHTHRGLKDVLEIIEQASISAKSKSIATKIFEILAVAEAKAHGTTIEDVHFHEVGAVDSIVDILSVAICLDDLDVSDVIITELYEGCGTIRCQHGILPIPVPAVVNIVEQQGLNLRITNTEAELVTPTGAAIVAAIRTMDQLPDNYRIVKVGMGAGKREYKRTSVLRGMFIEAVEMEREISPVQPVIAVQIKDYDVDEILKIESNIDDCTGEVLGYTMDCLMKAGALDVNYTPIYMKKNRPGYQLNVICRETDGDRMENIIFHETSTIGIRRMKMERHILQRELKTVETGLGPIDVKICRYKEMVKVTPEYESVAKVCREKRLPFAHTMELLKREVEKQFNL